jgi:hypothetical protein
VGEAVKNQKGEIVMEPLNRLVYDNWIIKPSAINVEELAARDLGLNGTLDQGLRTLFRWFKSHNSWKPFTEEDFLQCMRCSRYSGYSPDLYSCYKEMQGRYMVKKDDLYYVTYRFVKDCFCASPQCPF